MTYCVALCLHEGLVFLSDSRTNAGIDHVSTFRKMAVFQNKNDRFFALMSAGNLAITQSVKEILLQGELFNGKNLWTAKNAYEASAVVGEAVRRIQNRDEKILLKAGIEFNCSFIFGGQVKGDKPRLFQIYSAGNFIESTTETCYFQIGEEKYGKPILDRVVKFHTPLDLATKCVLISMDSTLKSNLSVGLPLDLIVYETDHLETKKMVTLDESNPYFSMIHDVWAEKLRTIILQIPQPEWNTTQAVNSIRKMSKKLGAITVNQKPKSVKKLTKKV